MLAVVPLRGKKKLTGFSLNLGEGIYLCGRRASCVNCYVLTSVPHLQRPFRVIETNYIVQYLVAMIVLVEVSNPVDTVPMETFSVKSVRMVFLRIKLLSPTIWLPMACTVNNFLVITPVTLSLRLHLNNRHNNTDKAVAPFHL